MKSKNALIGTALLFLVMAVFSSVVMWADVSTAVKIGMFAFGFGSGVAVSGWIAATRNTPT